MRPVIRVCLMAIAALVIPLKMSYDSGGWPAVLWVFVFSLIGWIFLWIVGMGAMTSAAYALTDELRHILCRLYTTSGSLPGSRFPVHLREFSSSELVSYARRVADDTEFWETLGEKIGYGMIDYVTEPYLLGADEECEAKSEVRERIDYILSVLEPRQIHSADEASDSSPRS